MIPVTVFFKLVFLNIKRFGMEEIMQYIVVVGGEMSNKGAQSMLFQIVSEMKKRYPSKKTVALTDIKPDDAKSIADIYSFEIVPFGIRDIFYLYGGVQTVMAKVSGISKENIIHLKEILNNTCMAFDVSGYAFSSSLNTLNSIKYLYRIAVLKKYTIPTVLMPQSFGPFHYKFPFNQYIKMTGKKLLPYPAVIFAREQHSFDAVKKQFNLNNVCLSKDMVLTGKEVIRDAVLKTNISLREYPITKPCTAVVPNNMLVKKISSEKALHIYQNVIDALIKYDKDIYIVQHSEADTDLCRKIKEYYRDNPRIILLQENLNCLEYDLLIRQFDFIIASRYHSLVHAYKQNVPCIAIGWSEKYDSLMAIMGQSNYMIDARNIIDGEIPSKISIMQENYEKERIKICNIFTQTDENLYDKIFKQIKIGE